MLDPLKIDDVLRRGGDVATTVAAWRGLDEQRRKLQGELDTSRQAKNAANERMAKLDKKSAEFTAARDELKALSGRIKEGEAELGRVEAGCEALLLTIPNAPHATVPAGAGEADNVVHHAWGDRPVMSFPAKPHWEIGERLGILDFEAGARIARGPVSRLRGGAAAP